MKTTVLFLWIMFCTATATATATPTDDGYSSRVTLSSIDLRAIEHAEAKFRETLRWNAYQVTLERTGFGYDVTFWRPEDVQTIDYRAAGKDGAPDEIFARQTQNQHQFVVTLDKKLKIVGTQMCCK